MKVDGKIVLCQSGEKLTVTKVKAFLDSIPHPNMWNVEIVGGSVVLTASYNEL